LLLSSDGDTAFLVIPNAAWNGTIAAGAEISFGFQADGVAGELPSNKKLNGVLLS